METLLKPDETNAGFTYYAAKAGADPTSLGPVCGNAATVGKQTEMDVLCRSDDVLICVEVKGRRLRAAARAGHGRKLESDLKATIGEATDQARRFRELVAANGGVWTPDGWVDLSNIAEVHCIAVTMDDLGPVGIALDDLVRAGIVTDDRAPWIVSTHDLEAISRVVERPGEFLLYLRRRTEPDFAKVYEAVDELDLFMLFVGGGLFLHPDPDKVFAANPTTAPPSGRERRQYRNQLVPTQIGTHTDPLDAWMYASEAGLSVDEIKPRFGIHQSFESLVTEVDRYVGSAGIRGVADLLSLAGDTQSDIVGKLGEVIRRTRADGDWHSFATNVASEWGTFALFAGSHPVRLSEQQARLRLDTYSDVKSHQLHADRSIRIMVDARGDIESILYRRHPVAENPELDALAQRMKLGRSDGRPSVPPSARRGTRRLRGRH